MKQGTGKNTYEGKPTQTTHPVSPSAAGTIGQPYPNQLYSGRGIEAPAPKSTTIHKCGSQRG